MKFLKLKIITVLTKDSVTSEKGILKILLRSTDYLIKILIVHRPHNLRSTVIFSPLLS